jgi:CRP-like cAMP-binding protein
MPLRTALAVVSRRGWYAERSDAVQHSLAKAARVKRFARYEALYLCGDEPNGIFGLVDGALDINIPRADGLDFTIHRADSGFWIGDLAMFGNQFRLVSVIAADVTTVIYFDQITLRQMVETNPALYPEFYALTYKNTELTLRLLANLAISNSEARVAVRLLMNDESENSANLGLSQSKLAELVGLSTATLQRVLKRFQDSNMIKTRYGRIEVLDRHGLLTVVRQDEDDGRSSSAAT